MSDTGVPRDELAARLEAVEARTDAKFERLLGEIRTSQAELKGKLDGLPGRFMFVTTIVGTAVALAALVFAMLAYGGDLFGQGLSASAVARQAAQEAVAAAKK